jgi:ribosome-associated protein
MCLRNVANKSVGYAVRYDIGRAQGDKRSLGFSPVQWTLAYQSGPGAGFLGLLQAGLPPPGTSLCSSGRIKWSWQITPSPQTRNRTLLAIATTAAHVDHQPTRSLERAQAAARVADLNRGRDITIIDLRKLTPVFDYFVVITGSSRRQLHAIAEEIDLVLRKEYGDKRLGIEGYSDRRWILLDFGDVVVHLFDEETRQYYDLEHLWAGAKRIDYVPPARPAVAEETLPQSEAPAE